MCFKKDKHLEACRHRECVAGNVCLELVYWLTVDRTLIPTSNKQPQRCSWISFYIVGLQVFILSCRHGCCSTHLHTEGGLPSSCGKQWPMCHAKFAIYLVIALALYAWLCLCVCLVCVSRVNTHSFSKSFLLLMWKVNCTWSQGLVGVDWFIFA